MSVIIRLVISSLVICRRISANTVVYEGGSGTTGIFSSPGFPSRYASNGTIVQYIFRITPSFGNATLGYIRLFFTDWYLSKYSKLTIYPDGNSSTKNYDPLDYRSRRPVAYSSGLVLLVTFVSGYGDTTEKYIGFKAQYEFYPGPRNAVTDADYNYSTMGEVHDSDVNGSFVTDFSYPWRALGDYVWVIFNPEMMHLGANVTLHMDSMLDKLLLKIILQKMILKVVIIVLLAVVRIDTQSDCTGVPNGPTGAGCHAYTLCTDGVGQHIDCLWPEEVYNVDIGGCDFAENVTTPCGKTHDCSGLPDTRYPDMTPGWECQYFFTCLGGVEVGINPCNPPESTADLVFDYSNQYCNWRDQTPPPCGTANPAPRL